MSFVKAMFFTLAFIIFDPTSVLAQNKGDSYGRIGAGLFNINDVGFSSSASAYGVTVTANGDWSFDPGYAFSALIGYKLDKNLAVEFEGGYSQSEYDSISGSLSVTAGGTTYTVSGSDTVDGDVQTLSGIANLIYNVTDTDFSPFIGIGIGFVHFKDTVDKVGTLVVNGEETSTNLAGNLIAGVNILEDIDIRYRYFVADTGSKGIDNATAHSLMAHLKFNF